MSDKYDVIIIGAGIGGLVAGNILAKNGMKVLILEKNPVPGGAVTTYYRNGYPIDIIHSICGLEKEHFLGRILDYLNITEQFKPIETDKAFIYFPKDNKKPVFCYTDLNKYKNELKNLFPNEKIGIENLFNKMEKMWDKETSQCYYAPSLFKLFLYPAMFPSLFKYRNYTFNGMLNEFLKSEDLKNIISVIWPYLGLDQSHVSGLYLATAIISYHKEKNYFVKSGFGKISDALAANFIKLGGIINYNVKIEKIILENKTVINRIEDNHHNSYYSKLFVSNIDSKKTFLELINKDSLPSRVNRHINSLTMSVSAIQIHIVADAEIDKEYISAGSIVLPCDIDFENKFLSSRSQKCNSKISFVLNIRKLQDFIPSASDNIYTFNVAICPTNYTLWINFKEKHREKEYTDIKDKIGTLAVTELKKYFSIREVKFVNVLTPLSFENWLNATEGAIYDLAHTPQQTLLNRLKHRTFLKNLFLVGAKTFPGNSVAGAALSALALSDIILNGTVTKRKCML
ncbi:MAG: NAD(P)/FAD-dependent oxidoreductase [Candidatus Omnitrophota bacterium]